MQDRKGTKHMSKLTISIPDAARLMGVGKNRVYEMAKSGQIPVLKIGNRYIIPKANFEAWLTEQAENHAEL